MKRRLNVTEADLKRIEATLTLAEAKTSGEIVPLIVDRCHDYWWVRGFYAVVFFAVTAMIIEGRNLQNPFAFTSNEILAWLSSALVAGIVLGGFHPFIRFATPKKWLSQKVHKEVLANFTALGLFETRDRTGVLIFISALERRVEILADKGIFEKTGEDYWSDQVNHVVNGIHRGRLTDALCEAIEQVGSKLTAEFPRKDDDTNEISNRVRLGRHQDSD